jgi:hypothetical protein
MLRPALTSTLTLKEFRRWYWLKSELVQFCRDARLQTTGSKPEVTERIALHLAGEAPARISTPRRDGAMPAAFAADTVIAPGWRCSPALGAYFRAVCGRGFRFNAAMRNFIHTQAGRTLADAAACYRQSVAPGTPKPAIVAQNQYNLHTRQYYQAHPNATRAEVIAAWKARRANAAV